jgi:hypothetical protein
MDLKSGVGGRADLDRLHPASKADGGREALRSPKPALFCPEMHEACVCFLIFAIRFHSQFAGPPAIGV